MRKFTRWFKKTRVARTYRNFSQAGGNLLAAGMSFQAIFAVFAAVWVGFSLAGVYLNDHPDFLTAIIDFVNAQIPGLISKGGPIDPDLLASRTSVGWTGGLAIVVVLYTAINWLNYVRVAMRKIFGLPIPQLNYVLLKIYDLVIALAYGVLVFVTAGASVFVTNWAGDVVNSEELRAISPGITLLIQISSLVLIVLVDAALIAALIRIISAVSFPFTRLLAGSIIGAFALGILKLIGAILINRPSSNPLITSFAVFLGLLIYFNVVSRIFLLTVSWIQIGLEDDGIEPRDLGWVTARSKSQASQ